jgi:hypothetical protein
MIFAAIGPAAPARSSRASGGAKFAIGTYIMALIITFILALLIDALAPIVRRHQGLRSPRSSSPPTATPSRGSPASSICSGCSGAILRCSSAIYPGTRSSSARRC